jgi:hypothetical protein
VYTGTVSQSVHLALRFKTIPLLRALTLLVVPKKFLWYPSPPPPNLNLNETVFNDPPPPHYIFAEAIEKRVTGVAQITSSLPIKKPKGWWLACELHVTIHVQCTM